MGLLPPICYLPYVVSPLDFWMGDQFCSLAFTLSSFWTLGCAYNNEWKSDTWALCGMSNHWLTPFVLSCLPSLARFVQCIKRYADSGLYTHLINVSGSRQWVVSQSDSDPTNWFPRT